MNVWYVILSYYLIALLALGTSDTWTAELPKNFMEALQSDHQTLQRVPSANLRALIKARPKEVIIMNPDHVTSFMQHVRQREGSSRNSDAWDGTNENLHLWVTGQQGYRYDQSTQQYSAPGPSVLSSMLQGQARCAPLPISPMAHNQTVTVEQSSARDHLQESPALELTGVRRASVPSSSMTDSIPVVSNCDNNTPQDLQQAAQWAYAQGDRLRRTVSGNLGQLIFSSGTVKGIAPEEYNALYAAVSARRDRYVSGSSNFQYWDAAMATMREKSEYFWSESGQKFFKLAPLAKSSISRMSSENNNLATRSSTDTQYLTTTATKKSLGIAIIVSYCVYRAYRWWNGKTHKKDHSTSDYPRL